MQPTRRRRAAADAGGFTLVELLIVILIIAVLVSILIPTVSKVRQAVHVANTKNQLSQITGAIERYYGEQHQYPGPLDDSYLMTNDRGLGAPGYPINDATGGGLIPRSVQVTQEENLVLGLFGGLKWVNSGGFKLCYDPDMLGRGMMNMNPNQPKKYAPYLDDLKMLSPYDKTSPPTQYKFFSDGAGSANDSPIPEIVDKFPSPMPFLYLRAHPGRTGVIANNIGTATAVIPRHYDLSDAYAYTGNGNGGRYIGEGKKIRPSDYVPPAAWGTIDPSNLPHGFKDATPPSGNARTIIKGDTSTPAKTYVYPYDAWPYFRDPGTPYIHTGTGNAADDAANTPRAKDRFILISPGLDRVYGTADDICSFGDVLP
jgi:prepilin-type N-terminal cleavage/methylation domain-containing protein